MRSRLSPVWNRAGGWPDPSSRIARGAFAAVRPRSSWYEIRNQAAPVAEVYIYDEIGYFGITAGMFIEEMRAVTAPVVDLHINSPGGEIYDGIAIFNCLRTHPSTVNVTVDALAASAASFIAMAGQDIVMAPYSQMMIHDGIGLCIGNAATMRDMAERLDAESNNIAKIYADRAGGKIEEWRQRMEAETWYSAEEAVTAGLADRVAELVSTGAPPAPVDQWDRSIFRYPNRNAAPKPSGLQPTNGRTVEPARRTPDPPAEPARYNWDADTMREMLRRSASNMPEPQSTGRPPASEPVKIDPLAFRNGLIAVQEGTSA